MGSVRHARRARSICSPATATGNIYKLKLNGKLLGWARTRLASRSNSCLIHELHCESETVIYKGACTTWKVEKITISAGK